MLISNEPKISISQKIFGNKVYNFFQNLNWSLFLWVCQIFWKVWCDMKNVAIRDLVRYLTFCVEKEFYTFNLLLNLSFYLIYLLELGKLDLRVANKNTKI